MPGYSDLLSHNLSNDRIALTGFHDSLPQAFEQLAGIGAATVIFPITALPPSNAVDELMRVSGQVIELIFLVSAAVG